MPSPSDEIGEGQAEPELAVLQALFKETGVVTPEKIKTFFTTVHLNFAYGFSLLNYLNNMYNLGF